MKLFTTHQVDAMRRDAKQRARDDGIPMSKALDQIAQEQGYRNWSLLRKNGCIASDQPQPYIYRRAPEEVAQAMRVAPEPRSWTTRQTRSDFARGNVQALDDKFIDAANAVDFAICYVEGILAQPRFRLSTRSVAYWEMRLWSPYAALRVNEDVHILVNRYYKPQGSTSDDWAFYENHPHLHLRLHGESWRGFAHETAKEPYLFHDGLAPWSSRKNAEAYLRRLRELRNYL